ncbi:sensor histidine kinase [Dermacoccaceae bacterium W4C1]
MTVTQAIVLCLAAFVVGLLVATVVVSRRTKPCSQPHPVDTQAGLRPGAEDVLTALRSLTIVVDGSDAVVRSNPAASALGLVRGQSLAHEDLRTLVREVRRDGQVREIEYDVARGPVGTGRMALAVRMAALHNGFVLILVEDRTHSRRVEETRRDFVVNVSHELKTPVGGLALLAEAVSDARDDPEAVARFSRRMQLEADRLGRLVAEIVELSRLQVGETLIDPQLVDINSCVAEALDHAQVVAADRGIELVGGPAAEAPKVYGDRELIVTAVRNLVTNAVNYSEADTRVSATVRRVNDPDALVEIAVADQGLGISAEDQERIFERFYRVDAARSRATGGTGLGLAIVKHICTNHGGDVTVWSEPGHGSTFTLRLPVADLAFDAGELPHVTARRAASSTQEGSA